MAITTKRIPRVFLSGATEYPDPAPTSRPEQALAMLATTNPAFNNAALEGPRIEGGKEQWKIKLQVGTKG
jgi:PRTRC genetic system protein C